MAGEVVVSLELDFCGVGSLAAAGWHLAVAAVERVYRVHAVHHFADRRESFLIERLVIAEVEEQLRGAAIGSILGISESAAGIALFDGVVGDVSGGPELVGLGVAAYAELDEAADGAEEA